MYRKVLNLIILLIVYIEDPSEIQCYATKNEIIVSCIEIFFSCNLVRF